MKANAKVTLNGKPHDGVTVPIFESTTRWSAIKLEDGSTLRFRPVVTEVVRVIDVFNEDGQPVYAVKSTNVLTVTAPGNLRQDRVPTVSPVQ